MQFQIQPLETGIAGPRDVRVGTTHCQERPNKESNLRFFTLSNTKRQCQYVIGYFDNDIRCQIDKRSYRVIRMDVFRNGPDKISKTCVIDDFLPILRYLNIYII